MGCSLNLRGGSRITSNSGSKSREVVMQSRKRVIDDPGHHVDGSNDASI